MRTRTAVVGIVLIAVGSGCGESNPDDAGAASASTVQTTDGSVSGVTSIESDFVGGVDGPVMFASGPATDGGEDALIEGVLVRDGDCLFVGDGAPGSRFAVLWPFGTSWDDEAQEVVGSDGTRISLGSTLSAGGGYGSPETMQRLLDSDVLKERADACAEGEFRELAHVQHSISSSASSPSSESAEGVLPLHQQSPTLEMGVDGASLVELSLGFEAWNGESADPAEHEPSVGVVVAEGATLSLLGVHTADATITLFRLDETMRFVQDATIEWNGTETTTPAPQAGTWFVDVRSVFGPSLEYEGDGVLRTGFWLHVTPGAAPCDSPSVTPVFSPDSNVTGVVDRDGCPVVASDAALGLDALTPWFHCNPWPPILQLRLGDDAATRSFWQYVSDPSEIVNMAVPADSVTTGWFIAGGEVLTSASDPDAVYVQAQDGSVQRWADPEEEVGCA